MASKPAPVRPVNPPPVRSGVPRFGVAPVKQAVGQSVPQATKIPTMPARKPQVPPVSKGGGDGQGGERRVTRAMVKAQTTGPAAVSMQPAIAKMKNLTLHSKPKVSADQMKKPNSVTAVDKKNQKGPHATSGRSAGKASSKEKVSVAGDTEMKEKQDLDKKKDQVVQKPASRHDAVPTEGEPKAAKPKKKIMGIDSVYVEFK